MRNIVGPYLKESSERIKLLYRQPIYMLICSETFFGPLPTDRKFIHKTWRQFSQRSKKKNLHRANPNYISRRLQKLSSSFVKSIKCVCVWVFASFLRYTKILSSAAGLISCVACVYQVPNITCYVFLRLISPDFYFFLRLFTTPLINPDHYRALKAKALFLNKSFSSWANKVNNNNNNESKFRLHSVALKCE
jgi:hypothetical protein